MRVHKSGFTSLIAVIGALLLATDSTHAQQERVHNHHCRGFWGEINLRRVFAENDPNALDKKVLSCARSTTRNRAKEFVGYDGYACGMAQSIIPCPEPGTPYVFSTRARLTKALVDEEGPGRVLVEFFDKDKNRTRPVEFKITDPTYEEYSKTFTVPAGAVWCRVAFMQNKVQYCDMNVDYVSLKAVASAKFPDDTPKAPSNLRATVFGSTMIKLEWDPVPDARSYVIERSGDKKNKFKGIFKTIDGGISTAIVDGFTPVDGKRKRKSGGSDAEEEKDNLLLPGRQYKYRIKAISDFGESKYSNIYECKTIQQRKPARPGATYYVDATLGNDKNDGMSQKTAWKTFFPLDRIDLGPGNKVLLKKGEVWEDPMHLHGAGAAGKEILVSSYGEANAPKPEIRVLTKHNAAIRMRDMSYVRVEHLKVSNWHPFHRVGNRAGIEAGAHELDEVSHLTFDDIHIDGVRSTTGGGPTQLKAGFNMMSASSSKWINHLTIKNCLMEHVEQYAMVLWYVNNALVTKNVTDYSGFNAFLAHDLNHSRISHNHFKQSGSYKTNGDNAHVGFYGGINTVLEYNVLDQGRMGRGNAFTLDASRGYILQYNYIINDQTSLALNHGAPSNVFRYNISEGMASGQFWIRNLGGRDTRIHNNVLYMKEGQEGRVIRNGIAYNRYNAQKRVVVKNVWCQNNIIYCEGPNTMDLITQESNRKMKWDPEGIHISNNVYFGKLSGTLEDDDHPLRFDPQFVGPVGKGDVNAYRLKPSSPCFKAGVVIKIDEFTDRDGNPIRDADGNPIQDTGNGGKDFFGNPVPANTPPTIGAFQAGP